MRFSTHGGYDASVGLGYDAVGKSYKVARLTTLLDHPDDEHPTTLAQVYSLATGSWGLVRVLPRCVVPGSWVQAFVNGALHWLALRWMGDHFVYFVVAFDVGSESYREVMLPKRFKTEKSVELRLCASGDMKSIALFVRCKSESDCFLDIWVMKEYCIEKSWTKLMILTPQGPKRSLPEPLCFRRIGEVVLVLEDDRELVSLDIGSKQFKSLGISGGQVCSVDFFEESLVLLDRKDAVSY
uniref:F-box protein CPR30-like isoform X2 n=1 Tax=Fragaria vesca subsp. vesca TaxID=101020 RepID=UPI0005C94784|nr:PREDICTED: F-box protein CPR30-like isoform X2 [Fragaria vesca subsp. vesca]